LDKILHIVHDDKFIDAGYRNFEAACPNRNKFILFNNQKKLRYIKSTPVEIYSSLTIYNKKKIKKIIKDYYLFIFHSLSSSELYVLDSLPKDSKILWIGWGYDYYDLIGRELLKPITKSLYVEKTKNSFFQKSKSFTKRILFGSPDKISLLNKIDFFSPVIYEDYVLLKQVIPELGPKYVSWNYEILEDDVIRDFEDTNVNGENILLGNSASFTNNHLDAFENLKKLDLSRRKIIVPLNYGDVEYRNQIVHYGMKDFGDSFVPLIKFMPINDYLATISSCSIVIMNHLRQQAIGNIVIMLYLGAKVFLDPENPVFDFFKKQGAYIYALEELATEIDSRLLPDQVEHNRTILRTNWSRNVILKKTKDIIAKLEKVVI